jgi:predicted N-acetyltransferase YhbS
MSLEMIQIDAEAREWHEPFLGFVPRIFPGVDFRLWYARCGWPPGFVVRALVEGTEVVSSVARSAVQLVVEGQSGSAWQLGTVGTLAGWRGRGLAARLLREVLAQAASEPLFLFANDTVLDFYPRFGFERAEEHDFVVDRRVRPASNRACRLELGEPEHRRLVERLAASARPVTERFGARDYGTTLLWHLTYSHPEDIYYLEAETAVIIARARGDLLTVYDVLAEHTFDLEAALPRVIEREVARVEFGFTPERWFPAAPPDRPQRELFVRAIRLPTGPFRFPVLAHT